MEELTQRQQYELAFHLLPSFTEAELDEKRREIEETISKNGGLVSRYGEIKKMKLAYPLKKERFSNFAYVEFFAPAGAVEKINKEILLNENVLRHLVIKKEKEKTVKLKPLKPRVERPKETLPLAPAEGEIKETKELDKKIEEILEKL